MRPRGSRGRGGCRTIGFLALLVFGLGGCATYSERLVDARTQANLGDYPNAVEDLNDFLGVDSAEEIPDEWKGDRPLAVLERAVLLQAEARFELSARDMGEADTELELLDLKNDAVGKIGEWVYSDSSKHYALSPTERVNLNALNLANYLALGDLSGAAVEARRFENMREYLTSIDLPASGRLGAYLSGFVFERSGEGDRALRFYEEALAGGSLSTLTDPVLRLAASNPYRGPNIEALLAQPSQLDARSGRPAEILVVVALGRVPYKVPERLPIGLAIGIGGTFVTGNTAILERSAFKVVVYPELTSSGTRAHRAEVRIDGTVSPVEDVANLRSEIEKEYELIKPRMIGAALTRLITRAITAEGVRAAGRQVDPIVGLLAALAAEGTMVALDKPDTRSWTFLPERVVVSRSPVSPGEHTVEVTIPGVSETRVVPVEVAAGGYAVVVVTVPR